MHRVVCMWTCWALQNQAKTLSSTNSDLALSAFWYYYLRALEFDIKRNSYRSSKYNGRNIFCSYVNTSALSCFFYHSWITDGRTFIAYQKHFSYSFLCGLILHLIFSIIQHANLWSIVVGSVAEKVKVCLPLPYRLISVNPYLGCYVLG